MSDRAPTTPPPAPAPARAAAPAQAPARSPSEPSLWEVMAVDPSIPIDPATLSMIISDQRRRSRALLYPWLRVASRIAVTLIVAVKRVVPVRLSAHAPMDR